MTSTETAPRTLEAHSGVAQSSRSFILALTTLRQRFRTLRWLSLLLFPIGCGLASIAIGQDITGDTLLYHYYDAWAFLHGQTLIDVLPGRFQTLINPLEDVPLYLLDTHVAPTFAAFIAGFEQGFSPLIVYLIARRMTRSRWIALFAALASAIAGGFVSELGSMMGDTTVSPFFLLGILFAVIAMQEQHAALRNGQDGAPVPIGAGPGATGTHRALRFRLSRSTWWWLGSGLSLGVGMGLKFAEASMAAGMLLGTLFVAGNWRSRARALVTSAIGVFLGNAVTAGYWTYLLWRHFGDPFAFTGGPFWIFHSRYFPGAATAAPWHGPTSFLQGLYFPVYWFFHATAIVGISLREASLPIAYVLLLVLLAFTAVRIATRATRMLRHGGAAPLERGSTYGPIERVDAGIDRYLIVTFVATLVVWVKLFAVYRYLMPLELLSPVAIIAGGRRIASAVEDLWPRARPRGRSLGVVFAALCALCIATESPGNYWARIPFGSSEYRVATPAMLRNDKLNAVVELGGNPDSFVLPELHSRFIAIGGIGDLLTPATLQNLHAAFAKVRRSGGNVVGFWTSSNPGGNQAQFIATLGDPGLRQVNCVQESLYVGFGYEPIGFCQYVPIKSANG